MTKRRAIGKVESAVIRQLGRGGRAGEGIAIVQPAHEITVTAAGRAKRRMLGVAGLAANRAQGTSRTG